MVTFRKKIALFICLLAFSMAALAVEDYRSGQHCLEGILLSRETGMGMPKHVNQNPAESLNLMHDLCYRELIRAIPCKTKTGHVYIEEMLKTPYRVNDKGAVLTKQNFIKKLVENPALKNKFDELLLEAKYGERDAAVFFSDTFKHERCPELAQIDLLQREESFQYPLKKWFNANSMGRSVSTPFSFVTTYLQAKAGRWGLNNAADHFYHMFKADSKDQFFGALVDGCGQLGVGTFATLGAFFGVYNVYRDYINAVEKRSKMNGISKLIKVAKELEELCNEHGLQWQFKMSDIVDEKTLELMQNLEHSRYETDSLESKVFNIVEVHTLAYDIYVHDKLFAPVLACIAEMDAYNAFATNIIDSYDKENKFCFVNFLERERAEINARSFWSLLVKNPVSNTLCEAQHILLTGPNAGGKSTTIRAIMQNILFGQCFGVAAAEAFDFTMFDVVHSYLSITDNILSGESRFKAEVNRAISIFRKIDSLQGDQKYFFALDELFTGTSVEQGEKCAHAFIKRVAKRHNVQCIYATHFEKLKEMGSRGGSGVANYKVDSPIKLADGSLKYPFTISPGASTVNIALDIAQQAGLFDEEMDADAFIAAGA
jgi:hypothetical protein